MKRPARKQWVWIGTTGVFVMAVLADVGGAYAILKATAVELWRTEISTLWATLIVPVTAAAVYWVARSPIRHLPDVKSVDTVGQFYERVQEQITAAKEEILVVGLEKDWVFPLVVSVAIARARDVSVTVVYFEEFHERYNLLKLLGCVVKRVEINSEQQRMAGVFTDSNQILTCRATVRTGRPSEAIFGRYYFSSLDFAIIRSTAAHLRQEYGATLEPDAYRPQIVEVPDEDLIERLRNVRFYERAQIQIKNISISDTRPVSSFVVRYKLNQVLEVIRLYEDNGWALFRPAGILLENGMTSLIVPPIVEEHDGQLYVAEGHSRLYALAQRGQETARVVIVRDVSADLPMQPTRWRNVIVGEEKNEKRDPQLARYIETATHVGIWSVGDATT